MSLTKNGFWKRCRVGITWALLAMIGGSVSGGVWPSVVEGQDPGQTYMALAIIWCDLDEGCEVVGISVRATMLR